LQEILGREEREDSILIAPERRKDEAGEERFGINGMKCREPTGC